MGVTCGLGTWFYWSGVISCLHGVLLVCVCVFWGWRPMILIWFDITNMIAVEPEIFWVMTGHGGEGALTNTSLGWCVCARVLCVCVCIVLTNVWPGGFWCALTLSTVVIKTAALQRRRWLHYLQWSLTYMSFFQRGHPICFCGDGVSRGQWKLMELLSNSCWCSSSSLPVCLSIGGLGCVQMEKKKIVWILFPGWHYSIASLKLKKKMLS